MCDTSNHDVVFKSSRRTFMQQMCAGTAALAAAGVMSAATPAPARASSSAPAEDETWGLLIDLTRCSGCQTCTLACKAANNMPQPDVVPTKLSSDALSFVDTQPQPDGKCCAHSGPVLATAPGCSRRPANPAPVAGR